MIYPSINTLMEKFDSKYSLVIAVAKRAREICQTGVTFTECHSEKPVTIAIHEIAENKVTFKKPEKKEENLSEDMIINRLLEESLYNE